MCGGGGGRGERWGGGVCVGGEGDLGGVSVGEEVWGGEVGALGRRLQSSRFNGAAATGQIKVE